MALLLREDDVRAVLEMPAALDVLEAAFRAQGQGKTRNNPRSRIQIPDARGVLHILSAYVPGQPGHPGLDGAGLFGFKSYSAYPTGVRFAVNLYSGDDGRLLAIMEADWLGQVRTGAASGVATRYMARPGAAVVGMIGAGGQARTQLLAMAAARQIERVLVYGRDERRRAAFCAEMADAADVQVEPVSDAQAAIEPADIVVTATTARDPVLKGAWLKPGSHVNAMGSNWGHRREVDDTTVERAGIVAVDALDQAHIEAGDLLIPAHAGHFDWSRAVELGAIVAGATPARHESAEITLFKSLGIGLEDIAVAGLVYEQARQRGLGQQVDFLI